MQKLNTNLDILLIAPSNRIHTYQGLANEFAAKEPPVWAGLLATFLRRKGLQVDILDVNALDLGFKEAANVIQTKAPRLCAMVCYGQQPSASTLIMPGAGALAREIKVLMPEQPILFVGGHVAALPERTLRDEACDFTCDGEGPYTLLGLALALRENSPHYENVPGLLFVSPEDGEIVRTPPAPLVENLDEEMPEVAWDLLPIPKYIAHNWHCFDNLQQRSPYVALYTSLGCPFHCDFCCIQAPFRSGEKALGIPTGKNSYRLWSPSSVLRQIDILTNKYGVKNIKFADKLFVFNKEHVTEICTGIIERKYDLNIWAYTRIDSWNESLLALLRKAGVRWLAPGIESGSKRVRKDIHKNFQQELAIKSIKAFRKEGIHTIGNFLVGLPEDDMSTMRETLDFAKELNCEFMNLYCAMAYPGSQLHERIVKEGGPLPETWNGYSQHSYDALPLPTRYLSGVEVLRFRDEAFHEYYTNPTYLSLINRTFGAEAVRHLQRMTEYRLPRKHLEEEL